jgi:eukaryotic-like serine/threonine-protein kinase
VVKTTAAPPAGDPFAGTQYRALERIDAGGMGEVFLVEHRHLRRTFVAKALHTPLARHPQVVDRVRLEAQALGRLNHPNIVSISGFGMTTDGRPFLVMEHLQGRTLEDELAARGRLALREAIAITCQLLSGLEAAHALGIVHRDVKPDNLFLADHPPGGQVVKILDFGVARVLPSAPPTAPRPLVLPTETGAVIGTPRFLSPEAAAGERVDTRADLYGAGLVLYTMVAGRGPFDHVEGDGLLSAYAVDTPAPPSSHTSERIPVRFDEIVLRALAKDPGARFQTAAELRGALESLLQTDEPAKPASGIVTNGPRNSAPPESSPPRPAAALSSSFGVTDEKRHRRAGKHEPSRLALVLLFFVGAVVSALGAGALVTLLTSGR